ncbi:MAG: hypothetical protein HY830_26245 [Actinobacteria bacterium]|nr:hypothetical protein [Actinomycetota bacterium]
MERFEFDFALPLSLPLRFLGVRPGTARVEVGDEHLEVSFGPWRLVTALSNVDDVTVTGPYNPLKAYGVRVSLADLGVTFGTTNARGLCVTVREPVGAAVPGGLLRHPSMTVTVAEPERLARLLTRAAGTPRPLLEAVEADVVPTVPVLEPAEDRRDRERASRRARKAARTRAEHRAQEQAEAERATARRSAAARRGAAKRTAKRTPAERTPAERTPAKRTPAKRTPAQRTASTS